MNKLLTIAALTACATLHGAGWYAEPSAGIAAFTDASTPSKWVERIEFDTGELYGLAIGYDFGRFSAEIEGFSINAEIDRVQPAIYSSVNGSLSYRGGLVNGIYRFQIGERLQGSLGAGIGVSRMTFELEAAPFISRRSDSATLGMFHGLAGFDYSVSDQVSVGVRVDAYQASSFGEDIGFSPGAAIAVRAGVTFSF